MSDVIKDIIKSLHWFPGFMLGSCLYLFFKEFRATEKMKRHYKKNTAIFRKSISKKKKNKVT